MIDIISFDKWNLKQNLVESLAKLMQKEWSELNAPYSAPPIDYFKKMIQLRDNSSEKQNYILAKQNEKFIGFATLWINLNENQHISPIDLYVEKEFRNLGISKLILKKCFDNLSSTVKKIQFTMRTDPNAPDYPERQSLENFHKKNNAKMVYNVRRSASKLMDHDLSKVEEKAKSLEIKAKKQEFDILLIENGEFNKYSKFDIQNMVLLVERIKNDMPKEDRELDTHKLSIDNYMERFEKITKFNDQTLLFVAIDNKTGKPVAYTETWFYSSQPDLASQGDTGVLHEYRGKKLGLTLKYQMLFKILSDTRFNKVTYWGTHNAHSNRHMININDELGYMEDGFWKVYEYSKNELEELLN